MNINLLISLYKFEMKRMKLKKGVCFLFFLTFVLIFMLMNFSFMFKCFSIYYFYNNWCGLAHDLFSRVSVGNIAFCYYIFRGEEILGLAKKVMY